MGFVDDISDYRSLAIVGLEKNTGKTECLNYILRRIKDSADRFALTSIGIDGENRDQVCQTPKPEIIVPEGMIFVTSEKHYRERRLVAEIMEIDDHRTALGRLVIARAKTSGKVLLSGPADTAGLKSLIRHMKDFGVRTTLVDGALSRLSLASPTVTEAMVLATGAAVSGNIRELVRRTRYVCDLPNAKRLTQLAEEVDEVLQERLDAIQQGVWAVGPEGECIDLKLPSVFMLEKSGTDLLQYGHRIFIAGAVSDKVFQFLRVQKQTVELIVRDFTRVFAAPESFYAFLRKGGRVQVLHRSRLLAVTINPQSPGGLLLDSLRLQQALEESLQIPVYDVKKIEKVGKNR